METQVRTPQMVFMQPQRLIVPLFQRPYVWNEENQWAPFWADVTRVAERLLADPHGKHQAHFLGAVVPQQVQNQTGSMQERTVIDGQQRLTTLQLLLDALHAELDAVRATQPAMRVEALVTIRSDDTPPLLDAQMVTALEELTSAVDARDGAAAGAAAIDVGHAGLDLQLRHRAPADVDTDRLDLWDRQLALDEAAGDDALTAGDRVIIETIRVRSGQA